MCSLAEGFLILSIRDQNLNSPLYSIHFVKDRFGEFCSRSRHPQVDGLFTFIPFVLLNFFSLFWFWRNQMFALGLKGLSKNINESQERKVLLFSVVIN